MICIIQLSCFNYLLLLWTDYQPLLTHHASCCYSYWCSCSHSNCCCYDVLIQFITLAHSLWCWRVASQIQKLLCIKRCLYSTSRVTSFPMCSVYIVYLPDNFIISMCIISLFPCLTWALMPVTCDVHWDSLGSTTAIQQFCPHTHTHTHVATYIGAMWNS